MGAQLRKSDIIAELKKGGSLKAIADRLHITTALLKKAKDHFNKGLTKDDQNYINLRSKPKTEAVEFIDDTEDNDKSITKNNGSSLSLQGKVITDDMVGMMTETPVTSLLD